MIVQQILKSKDSDAVVTVPSDTPVSEAARILAEKRIGTVVISDDNGATAAGILSERDIVRKLADTPGRTLPHRVEEVMTRDVETCAAGDALVTVLKRMTEGRFRHMPVMEGATLVQLVTIGDVVHYRLTLLEHEALQIKQLIVG